MKRPIFISSVGVLVGVVLTDRLSVILIIAATCGALALFRYKRLLCISLLIGIFLGGFTGICSKAYERRLRSFAEECIYFEGTVKSHTKQGYYLKLSAIGTETGTLRLIHFYSFLAYIQNEEAPAIGSRIILEGHTEQFLHAENPGQFDAADYYHGIGALFRIQASQLLPVRGPNPIQRLIHKARDSILTKLSTLYQSESLGLTAALLLGERAILLEEQRSLYSRYGLAHILAISGLHISILSEFLSTILLLLFPRKAADVITGILLLFYGMLCGFSISCLRAILCFLLNAYSRHFSRSYDSLSANAFLLIVVLFLAPYRVYDLSFQLSFSSGYLLAFLRSTNGSGKIFDILRTSLYMQSGLLPIILQSFYSFSIIGVFFNVLILSGIELLMVLLILSVTCSFLSGILGFLFAGPVHYMITMTELLMRFFSKLSNLEVCLGHQTFIRILLYYLLYMVILYFDRRKDSGRRRGLCLLLMLLWLVLLPNRPKHVVFATLSVGQGDCNVILIEGKSVVIDCGSSNKSDVGEKILRPFLEYYGYKGIDYLFLSHTDEDHMNGLSKELMSNTKMISTDAFFTIPEGLTNNTVPVLYTSGGEHFQIGKLSIDVLRRTNTEENHASDKNAHSQLLLLDYKGTRFLYTGDTDVEVLDNINVGEVYFVKIPHHGSRTSLSERFYETQQAEYAVISVGRNNYGHPHKEVTDLLTDYVPNIFVTREDGAVITELRGNKTYTYSFFGK